LQILHGCKRRFTLIRGLRFAVGAHVLGTGGGISAASRSAMSNFIQAVLAVIVLCGLGFTVILVARCNTHEDLIYAGIASAVPFLIATVGLVGVGIMQSLKGTR
jgi:hypothetical protein